MPQKKQTEKREERAVETRVAFECESLECREDNGKQTIRGYAAVWNKPSVPIYGMFVERVQKGAFANSIKKNSVRALWNHNTDKVLGNSKRGTLRLEEDDKGLRFELDLPNTQVGKDAYISVSRGDVDGMSFGFRVLKQQWDESDPKNIKRDLIEVDLREISPTAFPAYPQTSVKTRSVREDYDEYRATQSKEEESAPEHDICLMNAIADNFKFN